MFLATSFHVFLYFSVKNVLDLMLLLGMNGKILNLLHDRQFFFIGLHLEAGHMAP